MIKTNFESSNEYQQYYNMALKLFDDSVYAKYLEKDSEELVKFMEICKRGSNKYFLGFYVEDNIVQGIMAGEVFKRPFMKEIVASDLFIYVADDFRGKAVAGKELLKCYEHEATKRGAKVLFVAANTGINTDGTKQFFEKNSYVEYGTNYMRKA